MILAAKVSSSRVARSRHSLAESLPFSRWPTASLPSPSPAAPRKAKLDLADRPNPGWRLKFRKVRLRPDSSDHRWGEVPRKLLTFLCALLVPRRSGVRATCARTPGGKTRWLTTRSVHQFLGRRWRRRLRQVRDHPLTAERSIFRTAIFSRFITSSPPSTSRPSSECLARSLMRCRSGVPVSKSCSAR